MSWRLENGTSIKRSVTNIIIKTWRYQRAESMVNCVDDYP